MRVRKYLGLLMQTFLTRTTVDFSLTALTLDNKRLHKNALEAWQIMMSNFGLNPAGEPRERKGWVNHPATKMWAGHAPVLLDYIRAMTDEWVSRRYRSTIYEKAKRTVDRATELKLYMSDDYPVWMIDDFWFGSITSSHRTSLLFKNYEWYSQFNWPEDTGSAPLSYTYVWGAI